MPKYRVIGAKTESYWTIVNADDKLEAYDIADNLNSVDWIVIENDNVIEPIDVMEEVDEA